MSDLTRQRRSKTNDPLRPIFHFTAPQNWLNDPNGLVQWKGKYHLFYQHHPMSNEWGLIHWGHAIINDLVHWDDMPIPLTPTPDSYDEGGIWSGCLVDDNGVATILYTGVRGGLYEYQTVCIATSEDDDLATWQKYKDNPLHIEKPDDLAYSGFRDPYVWKQDGMWKMVIGAGAKDGCETVLLYEGDTLYDWRYVGPLYTNDVKNEYVYECPNFFKLGDKWVLIVSVMPTSHVEYFVGLFWNNHFIVETQGKLGDGSLYAPLTFLDENNRRLMIGWVQETQQNDTSDWAGVFSMPMELMLLDNNQLALTPISEMLDNQLATHYQQFHNVSGNDLKEIQRNLPSKRLKIVISDDLSKVIFTDGSIMEYFDFPDYSVRRIYDDGADLTHIAEFVSFPQKRIGIWVMPDTL